MKIEFYKIKGIEGLLSLGYEMFYGIANGGNVCLCLKHPDTGKMLMFVCEKEEFQEFRPEDFNTKITYR